MTASPRVFEIIRPAEPLPGFTWSAQELFLDLQCSEALLEGPRGTGKSFCLLVDFLRDVGRGFGALWNGVIFRQTAPELDDIKKAASALIPRVFKKARYNKSKSFWRFPDGEILAFRHMLDERHYWSYHGHQYQWIAFDELCSYPKEIAYLLVQSLLRSNDPRIVPLLRIRASTNSYGPGHSWVKARFVDPGPPGTLIANGAEEVAGYRCRIYTPWKEAPLARTDPNYLKKLAALMPDANVRQSWLGGKDRWNINVGAYFSDCLSRAIHEFPAGWVPPAGWEVTRSFDWGSSAPFACYWLAWSPGALVELDEKTLWLPRDTAVIFAEEYGSAYGEVPGAEPGKGLDLDADEVARRILERERMMGLKPTDGVADPACWIKGSGLSVAAVMAREGIPWRKAKNERVAGWQELRRRFRAALPKSDSVGRPIPAEAPGLYVSASCRHWWRTVPQLQRDTKKPDDLNSKQEDHAADAARYALFTPRAGVAPVIDTL